MKNQPSLYTLACDRNNHPGIATGAPPAGLLTPSETTVYHNLKTKKRRYDWLNGRYTAKQLIQQAFQEEKGLHLPRTSFEILPKENGAPHVSWLNANGRHPITLSISHAGNTAFCALCLQPSIHLGCDIEQIVPRSTLFVSDYFTPTEQTLVSQTSPDQQFTIINAIWSGKEAALKALELGLRVDTRAVTCLPKYDDYQPWQSLTITLDPNRLPAPTPTLAGLWRVQGTFVFTLVWVSPILG